MFSPLAVLTLRAAYRLVRHMYRFTRRTIDKCVKPCSAVLFSNVSAAL